MIAMHASETQMMYSVDTEIVQLAADCLDPWLSKHYNLRSAPSARLKNDALRDYLKAADWLQSLKSNATPQTGSSTTEPKAESSQARVSAMFVNGVNRLAASGQVQASIVSVYDRIGDLFISGDMKECDRLIRAIDTESTHADLILSFLMATAAAPSDRLPSRAEFFNRVRNRFARELGESKASEILDSLR